MSSQSGSQYRSQISICPQEIISRSCDEEIEDSQLYNEDSSLPLCIKEYYLNQKQLNRLSSKQSIEQKSQKKQTKALYISTNLQGQNIKSSKIQGQKSSDSLSLRETEYYCETIEQRNRTLSVELENQKIKNLHFEKMLSILINEENLQRKQFQKTSKEYQLKHETQSHLQMDNRRLKLRNEELQKELTHYKQLIYIANNNYEALQTKLQEAKDQISLLETEKQQRQKDFSEKLEELKHVMKSLMINLKNNPPQNYETQRLTQPNKDFFNTQNCFSFGDQDMNLREKKQQKSDRQQFFNSVNKTKTSEQQSIEKPSNKGLSKRRQQKQNVEILDKVEQLFDVKNFESKKGQMVSKLKSPKNLAVEQNYRKLFLKTLCSSSQKHK